MYKQEFTTSMATTAMRQPNACAMALALLLVASTALAQDTPREAMHDTAQAPTRDAAREVPLPSRQGPLADTAQDVHREAVVPLTLEQALRLAFDRNPLLAAAQRELEATDAQVLQGSLRPNPELVLQAEDASRVSRTGSAQIDLPIETANKRGARIDAAGRARDVAQVELAALQLRIRTRVTAAFHEVLAAQELLAVAQDSVNLAHRATDIAGKRVTAGKVSPVEETRARVAEAGARLGFAQADSELRNARRRLSSLWGNPSPVFMVAEGTIDQLPGMPGDAELERRLANSPLLLRAERELERRKSLVSVEQSRAVPDFTVSVGMKRRDDTIVRDQLLVGVTVPLPVFNRNQGNLLEALRREDKAREELQAARVSLASDAAQALERVAARRHEAELLKSDVLPGARSAYEAATIGFEYGKFSFLEVLDAQRTLFAAKAQYLTAIAAFHAALAELDSLLGQGGE